VLSSEKNEPFESGSNFENIFPQTSHLYATTCLHCMKRARISGMLPIMCSRSLRRPASNSTTVWGERQQINVLHKNLTHGSNSSLRTTDWTSITFIL